MQVRYALMIFAVAAALAFIVGLSGCSQDPEVKVVQGTKGDTGAPGQDGAVGPQDPQGNVGLPGATGVAGAPGVNGTNGQDASPTTVIQFCSGQDATTYGHFPEKGLCIANKLYGVYFDGQNAWLAEIVPGNYRSTSTSLACNFTVTSGCTVTP